MASPEPFVFHGGIFPFQARVTGKTPASVVRGDIALPSVGGDFEREDGPWLLPAIGGLGSGQIRKVKRYVHGDGDSGRSTTIVECILSGIDLPRVTAETLRAKLTSTFDGSLHTFKAEVEADQLKIDQQPFVVDKTFLATLQGKPAADIRSMASPGSASFATNGPGSNLACFVVQPAQGVGAVSGVVAGEYAIGELDRRLTMLRIDLPPAPPVAAGAAATSGGSLVLLQLFVNGHRPP